MINFSETWYDQYDIWAHSSVSFLISYTTNNYKEIVQMCDMGAILASLASVSWNGIRLQIFEKYVTCVKVGCKLM